MFAKPAFLVAVVIGLAVQHAFAGFSYVSADRTVSAGASHFIDWDGGLDAQDSKSSSDFSTFNQTTNIVYVDPADHDSATANATHFSVLLENRINMEGSMGASSGGEFGIAGTTLESTFVLDQPSNFTYRFDYFIPNDNSIQGGRARAIATLNRTDIPETVISDFLDTLAIGGEPSPPFSFGATGVLQPGTYVLSVELGYNSGFDQQIKSDYSFDLAVTAIPLPPVVGPAILIGISAGLLKARRWMG